MQFYLLLYVYYRVGYAFIRFMLKSSKCSTLLCIMFYESFLFVYVRFHFHVKFFFMYLVVQWDKYARTFSTRLQYFFIQYTVDQHKF